MEDELKKLPLRSVPDDYADRVMEHIAREQAKRRRTLIALGALTLALMLGIVATLPEVVNELVAWLNDPLADLAPWFALDAEGTLSNPLLIALLLGIGLCGVGAFFLAHLNEQWTGVVT